MKLANVLKVFGAAALVAGLTPYRITRDEETGGKKFRALFWEATTTPPQNEGEEKDFSVHFGFFSPADAYEEEPHFFADELTVEYTRQDAEAVSDEAEAAVVEKPDAVEPEEPEETVEEAAADEVKEEQDAEASDEE